MTRPTVPPTVLDRAAKVRFVETLARLEPFRRDVLVLHAADGLAFAEIAARLGIGVAEVERLLAAALIELDRAVTGDGNGDADG